MSEGESQQHADEQNKAEYMESWTAWIQRTTRDVEVYFRGVAKTGSKNRGVENGSGLGIQREDAMEGGAGRC